MFEIKFPLQSFIKTDETKDIHLWQAKLLDLPGDYKTFHVIRDTEKTICGYISEDLFKNSVFKTFGDIVSENKIMCGRSMVEPTRPYYFIRLFLNDDQNARFVLYSCNFKEIVVEAKDEDIEWLL
jgi:hypothetical protein